MKKRIVSLLLAALACLSLTACGDKTPSGGPSGSGDEKITLTVGVPAKANVTEWDENKLTLWLEEMSGYDLKIQAFSSDSGERATQISTMVAGGEPLPDVMLYFGLNDEMRTLYGKDGYLQDLRPMFEDEEFYNSLVEKYDWDYLAHIERNADEEVKDRLWVQGAGPNGEIWGFPTAGSTAVYDQPRNMLFINQSWLDKLGLEMPNSIEELEHVLKEFISKDPNGNGKADEMGMVGTVNIARGDIPSWLINNYIYLNDTHMYNCTDEGEIYLPYDRDEYRQGIKAVHEMFEQGLIAPMTWTLKESTELPALFSPVDEVSKIGVWAGHPTLRVTPDNPTTFEYTGLLPFEGATAPYDPQGVGYNNHVSGDSEHPKEAFELLYLLSTPEAQRRMRYGEPGVDWEWVDCIPECNTCAGEGINGDGKAVKILNTDAYSGQTDSTYANYILSSNNLRDLKNPAHADRTVPCLHTAVSPDDGEVTWSEYRSKMRLDHAEGYMAHANANNPENTVFKLIYTEDETARLGNHREDILTYAKQMRAKFITGEEDIDNDATWNKYVETIHSLGWDVAIECAQDAWDRLNP